MIQWLRIHLPMQGTWVPSLVGEYPTCHRATKPVPVACATTTEPELSARELQVLKPTCPGDRAAKRESPPELERARAPQRRPSTAINKTKKPFLKIGKFISQNAFSLNHFLLPKKISTYFKPFYLKKKFLVFLLGD